MTAHAELVAASNFSFLRGASKPEELAALAICDWNTVVVPAQERVNLSRRFVPGTAYLSHGERSDAKRPGEGFRLTYQVLAPLTPTLSRWERGLARDL